MEHPKTVRVQHPDFPAGVLINKVDFDEDEHTLHADDVADAAPAKMKVAEMRAELARRNVEVPEGAKKADLVALLEQTAS